MTNNYNFSDYTTDELRYTLDCLKRFFDAWNAVETAVCDANTNDNMLLGWGDFRAVEIAVKSAINARH